MEFKILTPGGRTIIHEKKEELSCNYCKKKKEEEENWYWLTDKVNKGLYCRECVLYKNITIFYTTRPKPLFYYIDQFHESQIKKNLSLK